MHYGTAYSMEKRDDIMKRLYIVFAVLLLALAMNMLAPATCFADDKPALTVSANDMISLRCQNIELTTVLRLFSDLGGVNIVAGEDVTGSVSVNLTDVPFEQALSAILGISGFTHYKVGEIIYVTSEERKAGLPIAASALEVKSFRIDHIDAEEIRFTLEEFLSPSGKVWLNGGQTLIVRDSPEYIRLAEVLIAEVDVRPRQVLISAKIININHGDNLKIGVGFDTAPIDSGGVEAISSGFATPLPADGDGISLSTTGLIMGTLQNDFQIFIEALNERSEVEILASPEILVVDGQLARIQVGERLGFRVTTTTDTATLESIEFLDVGTVLEVTPHIAKDGLIRMEISPKISTGAIDSTGLPSENTTEISTTMLVENNETIVIGGLMNATRQRIRSQIPFLGDLPFIGRLFGRRNWIDNENEVLVLLTPQIVGPKATQKMKQRIDATENRWGILAEKGLIHDGTPFPEESPSVKWGRLMRRDGEYSVESEDSSE